MIRNGSRNDSQRRVGRLAALAATRRLANATSIGCGIARPRPSTIRPSRRGAHSERRSTSRLLPAALLALLLALAGCGEQAERPPRAVPTLDARLHAALPADVREAGALDVVTDASYAPAASFAQDGRTIIGFEPDLGDALSAVLGVEVRWRNADFTGLLKQVAEGRADLAMSAITDTAERGELVDFVDYFSAGTSIVVQRGNPRAISDLAGLCGRRVAVEDGTVQVDLLERSQERCGAGRIRVRTFKTNADALVQLRTGRVDAVLNDYPPAARLASAPSTRGRYQLASTTQYEPGLYGIAVAKERPVLRDALKGAMDTLIRSGAYEDVLRRWGVAQGGVAAASLNAGSVSAQG